MVIFLNRGIDLLGKIQSLNRNVNFIWGQKLKEFLTTILEQACFFWATRIFWKLATILYLVKKDFLNIVFKGGKPAPEWVLNSVVKCESECKLFLPDRRIFSKLFLKLFCQLHSNRDVDFLPDFFSRPFCFISIVEFWGLLLWIFPQSYLNLWELCLMFDESHFSNQTMDYKYNALAK